MYIYIYYRYSDLRVAFAIGCLSAVAQKARCLTAEIYAAPDRKVWSFMPT